MKISLKTDSKGATVRTPVKGFMAAVETVEALIKIGALGDLGNCDAISLLRQGVCLNDPEMRLAGAVRQGDRTAFHISYGGDLMHAGDWILRINVSKKKRPFAFVEVHFDRSFGVIKRVISHRLPPADQAQWRL